MSMDINPVELLESGKVEQLAKWAQGLDNKKLGKLINDQRGSCEFVETLRAVLTGCRSIEGDCQQRFFIFCHCLDLIHSNELQTKVAAELVGLLLLETDLLTGAQLAELTQRFIDIVKNGCVQSDKALELLPKLLSSIAVREKIVYSSSDMTGSEYKGHVINTLCSSKWDSRCVIHLAAVFKDVPLATDELRFVTEKIIRSFSLLEIQDLPSLVYQLLLLSAKGHKRTVLEGIIDFFVEKDSQPTTDNDSEDLMETSHSAECLHQTEGTVILHVTFATKLDQDLGCALVKYLKSEQQSSSHRTLAPFVLALSLSIGRIPRFQQQIFELIKTSVLRSYKDQHKQTSSYWIHQMVNDKVDISATVLRTVTNSVHGWDHVTQGLVELGFLLMDSFGPRAVFGRVDCVVLSAPPGPQQYSCQLGASILLHTFKLHEIARAEILEQICNRVVTKASAPVHHYVDLLSNAIRTSPQVFLSSLPRVRDLLDYLPLLPPPSARAILHSLQPLLKLSITLRDALILGLRKSLFSRQLDSRKVGIHGFLLILKNFRVLGALPCSQASQSFSLSQVQVDVHQPYNPASNEALCLEIIGNLKRCFNQQADIRMILYEGLCDVISKNSQVCGPILDIISSHIQRYYESVEDVLPPIKLDPCITAQGAEVFLVEPLAHLLACTQRVLRKSQEVIAAGTEENEDNEDLLKIHDDLTTVLTSLSKRLQNCDTEDFQLDKSADFSLSTSVGVKNNIFTILLLGIYESLAEYTFLKDDGEISETMCNDVLQLFAIHRKLSNLLKDKTTTTAAKKAKSSATSKHNKSLLSVQFVRTVLEKLYIDKTRSHQKAVDLLRADADFCLYSITTATQKLQQIHDTGSCDGSGPGGATGLRETACRIGRVLMKCYTEYQRCDTATKKTTHQNMLASCLEGMQLVYKMVVHKDDLAHHLIMIEREHEDTEIEESLEVLVMSHIKKLQRLTKNILTSAEDMYNDHDLPGLLAMTRLLHRSLEPTSESHQAVCQWVGDLCQQQETDDGPTCKLLLSMLLEMTKRQKTCLPSLREMCRDIHSKMADIDPDVEVESRNYFGVISRKSATSTVIALVALQGEGELDDVEWLIARKKAELSQKKGDDSSQSILEGEEKQICSHLGALITGYHELVQAAVPVGGCITAVLKVVVRIYGALVLLTKYFMSKYALTSTTPSSKFEKLVKLSGTHLTQFVYSFISYVQRVSSEQIQAGFDKGKKSKKKMDAAAHAGKVLTLKDSKLIPLVIYTIEQYECNLIQLSKKAKVNLMEHIKLSTSRDFRINTSVLEQRLGSDSEEEEEGEEEVVQEGEMEVVAEEEVTTNDPDPTPPPTKKSKLSKKVKAKVV